MWSTRQPQLLGGRAIHQGDRHGSDPLRGLSVSEPLLKAERVGFEPTRVFRTLPLFESGSINHSDISPAHSISYPPGG